jgi:hypothetical protein
MNRPTALAGILFTLLTTSPLFAGLEIDLTAPIPTPQSGHLKMGGKNPAGDEINVNSRFITLNGKPIFPVMGEMHYARYPKSEWEQELLKMKAGGINIVSVYVFWIHHEEIEGQFDWSGDKDLNQFVQLCGKHGLWVYLRIGPWDHGEARNGGIPDWVVNKIPARQIRTTDPTFMALTKTLYTEIYNQVQGQLYKDGGPIIGIQVENEMRNNAPYMLALKNMAKDIGFDVPLYSMTGWGPAKVPENELLPMFGGYGDGFWIPGATVTGQSRAQYFFTHNPNDEKITMTSAPGPAPASMNYLANYPFLTCEIGGGMAIAYSKRPLMSADDVAAVALNKLGNGSMLMGYYMYHGGGHPLGKLSTLQESELTKLTNDNDMPEINYDFQAPIGQFGQERPSYDALRMLHMFIADFGADLCNMPSTLPKVLPKSLNDAETLRWAVRSDGKSGYVFINNYERGVTLPEHPATQFTLHLLGGDQTVPTAAVTIPSNVYAIWPFNLDMNGVILRDATAQLLCKLDAENGGPSTYVFFATPGVEATLAIDAKTIASVDGPFGTREDQNGLAIIHGLKPDTNCSAVIKGADGKSVRVLILTREQAMQSWKVTFGDKQYLLMSQARLVPDETGITLLSDEPKSLAFESFPLLPVTDASSDTFLFSYSSKGPGIFVGQPAHNLPSAKTIPLTVHQLKPPTRPRDVKLGVHNKPLPPDDADFDATAGVWQITVPPDALDPPDGINEVYLKIDYVGDAARAYIGDKLIDDDFYYGKPWEIGLKRFAPDVLTKGITLKIVPLRSDNPIYIQPEVRPKFGPDGQAIELRGITAEVQYSARMQIGK